MINLSGVLRSQTYTMYSTRCVMLHDGPYAEDIPQTTALASDLRYYISSVLNNSN